MNSVLIKIQIPEKRYRNILKTEYRLNTKKHKNKMRKLKTLM